MPPKRIDLAHQMPFGDAADRRIARHLRDQIRIHRVQRRVQTHTRGRVRRFTAGMTGAHNHDIVCLVKHRYFPIQNVEKFVPRISSVTTSPVNSFSAASAPIQIQAAPFHAEPSIASASQRVSSAVDGFARSLRFAGHSSESNRQPDRFCAIREIRR